MKKFKKTMSVLLSVLMMTSLLTVNTFAEDPEPKDFDEKSVEVQEQLADAVKAETAAGVVGLVTGNGEVVKDETAAEINDLLAIDAIDLAQKIEDAKQKEIERDATYAENAANNAAAALEDSNEAYKDASEAETRDEAKDAAKDAFVAAGAATAEANKAALAYAEAQKDYAITVAEIEAALAGGLITAEEAARKTEEAKKALEPALNDATTAKENADLAYQDAAEAANNAKVDLKEKTEALETAIANKTPEILLGTAEVAGLDAALIAADAAVALTNRTVENLENEVKGVEQQIVQAQESLDESINEISTLLDEFIDSQPDKYRWGDTKQDSDVEELRVALNALNSSKTALDYQLALKDYRDGIKESEEYNKYAVAKGKLMINESSNKDADIKTVTEYVINNTAAIRTAHNDIKLDSTNYLNFINWRWATAEDNSDFEGKNVLKLQNGYYEVKLDEKGNVQLYSCRTNQLSQSYSNAINLESKLNDYEQKLVNAETNNAEKTSNLIQTINSKTEKLEKLSETSEKAAALLNIFNDKKDSLVENSKEIDNLTKELADLNTKLNGGLIDKIVRSGLTSPEVKNYLENPTNENLALALGSVSGNAASELFKNLRDIDASTLEDGRTLINLVNTIGSGDLNAENVIGAIQDIASLLANNRVSEKTKQAFASLIQELIQDKRDEVAAELKADIAVVEEATQNVASAVAKVAAKDVELAKAALAKAAADAAAEKATFEYNVAQNAADKAQAALDAYKELMANPNVSKQELNKAKEAYENAKDAAEKAWGNYFDAKRILDVVFNNKNQNLGPQDTTISNDNLDPSKRHDIVVHDYNLNWVTNEEVVITDKKKAFAVDAFVAEDGKRVVGPVELDREVNFNVLVPSDILNADLAPGTNTRGYKVTRIHNGKVDVIATNLKANSSGEITISSDKFSIYVIEAHDYYVPVNYTIHKEVVKTSAN